MISERLKQQKRFQAVELLRNQFLQRFNRQKGLLLPEFLSNLTVRSVTGESLLAICEIPGSCHSCKLKVLESCRRGGEGMYVKL